MPGLNKIKALKILKDNQVRGKGLFSAVASGKTLKRKKEKKGFFGAIEGK